ncbi:GNAT family N-acetyltransferase (plasmid) [Arthrobacter sp. G.S.26]|uniref:GNAT family N-acetyltransferase n=1 Tax=Arthrobacter sp. G.S.26 TaxID=3433706 RepID=UPI003D77B9B8
MLTFSQASPDDVPAIVKMVNRAYSPARDAPGWAGERSFQPGDRTSTSEVRELVLSAEYVLIAGREDGQIKSCCSVTLRSDETAYLGLFAVEPDQQSAGVGRLTMEYAEAFVRARFGASRLEIEVMEHHVPLRAWYMRIGYQATGVRTAFPGSVEQKEAWLIHMAKTLPQA